MLKSFFLTHKKLLLVFFGVFLLLVIFISLFAPNKKSLQQPTLSRPTLVPPAKVSSIQKTQIGKSLAAELETLAGFEGKETLSNGNVQYLFTSELTSRPNIVLTDAQGTVTFERVLVPENPQTEGYATISSYRGRYGEPEKVIPGSRFYEWYVNTYIYANQGLAFIGNPNTDEIFEIHTFSSMSVDEYIRQYGQDISLQYGPEPEQMNP